MKPYKDKRFSIAVFDYGEYSYRENKSCITQDELIEFLTRHRVFNNQSYMLSAWHEIISLQKEIQVLKKDLKWAMKGISYFRNDIKEECFKISKRHNLDDANA